MNYRTRLGLSAIAVSLAMAAYANDNALPQTRLDLTGLDDAGTYRGFIVTYRDGTDNAVQRQASLERSNAALARTSALGVASKTPARLHHARHVASNGEVFVASQPLDAARARRVAEILASDAAVAFVQPDYLLQPAALPDDQYYSHYQWDYLPADGLGFIDPKTWMPVSNDGGANIQKAWDLSRGEGIVIASLDTGVTQHPDLDVSLADDGYDFITDSTFSGRTQDGRVAGGWDTGDWTAPGQCGPLTRANASSWHGTHVFGTAGGQTTGNGIGMAGTAHGAQVLPIRVLGHCGGLMSDIADAITWASGGHVEGIPDNAHPAQAISLSLGGPGQCPAQSVMARAIAEANERGATVVVAAGNSNTDVSRFTPANCPGVVTVAATGITSRRAWYSNYGEGITLAAPGGGVYDDDASTGATTDTGFIWSASNSGATTPTHSSYAGVAGTSQAAPHVTGTVAMMQSYRHSLGKALLTPAQVSELLRASAATPAIAPSAAKPIGAGLLDAYEAVRVAGEAP
ncbi:MAG TPA: S8 family serine peptidase [Dyella sp.]|uniref:S8 family serine peptidase n=1 Tax=Dyella sp. TaxID=1869338 RepID=UPI002F94DEE4